jgi:hypothetical protein
VTTKTTRKRDENLSTSYLEIEVVGGTYLESELVNVWKEIRGKSAAVEIGRNPKKEHQLGQLTDEREARVGTESELKIGNKEIGMENVSR